MLALGGHEGWAPVCGSCTVPASESTDGGHSGSLSHCSSTARTARRGPSFLQVFSDSQETYGYRRVHAVLQRGTIETAQGVFAPGHLGELTQIVDFALVDAVLEETGTVERRLRLLPSRVVVYF